MNVVLITGCNYSHLFIALEAAAKPNSAAINAARKVDHFEIKVTLTEGNLKTKMRRRNAVRLQQEGG